MEHIVKRFLLEEDILEKQTIYLNEIYKENLHKEFDLEIKRILNLRDHKNKRYYYLITFTIKDYDKIDVMDSIIEKYIISRLRRTALQVEKAHIVKELTQNKVPHWHAAVKSKKYISKDRFKYYIKQYGNIDISKNHSQNYKTMLKYITKSNIAKQIIGGLLEKLDQ